MVGRRNIGIKAIEEKNMKKHPSYSDIMLHASTADVPVRGFALGRHATIRMNTSASHSDRQAALSRKTSLLIYVPRFELRHQRPKRTQLKTCDSQNTIQKKKTNGA